ncbi:MAG: acyltransferase family protein [Methylotenera sp.]|jgi:peptidoglycan/LPS O-acetylase OafA/YrhL|uniref:acyltransferase family protein n=1 Tax=Methylotenera sp. TaxID=2051956 RepID=UPI0027243AB0|nr:acyltransferase family protein [Methylotenera sp.]MDO9150113.1 acyltransferase family protein [Methylotenera sp.]
MKYRSEIDGLRALAVTSVILFHAGLKAVSGGYVGVDIFFVISGFLITTIILSEIQAGNFSIANFYERRVRRILPALFFVMLVCVPFAWVVLSPYDMKYFSKSLAYVSIFLSNTIFYKQSGYFDAATELKPLLHTWSLGIEEQYYVFFPLILILLWRYARNYILHALTAIFIISLLYAQYKVQVKPAAAFYLLQSRIWELMAGSISAVLVNKDLYGMQTGKLKNPLSIAGFILVLIAIFGFDKATPFPSFYTLIPILGTVLIILFGTEKTLIARLFSFRPIVGVGLISFSAYLWHQPIFAFYRHQSYLEPSLIEMFILICAVLILAILTWKYIEQPFRNRNFLNRKQIFTIALIVSLGFISFGLVGYYNNGFLSRLSQNEQAINDYRNHGGDWRRGSCFLGLEPDNVSYVPECFANGDQRQTILLWGDSHAAALYSGLRKKTDQLTQLTAAGCPPVLNDDYDVSKTNKKCVAANKLVSQFVKNKKPGKIFLHAVWDGYTDEKILIGLGQTLNFIQSVSPESKVYIIGLVPQWKPTLPDVALRKHVSLDKETYLKMPLYNKLYQLEEKIKVVSDQHNVSYISPFARMCQLDQCLAVGRVDNRFALTAFDYGHLTEEGADILADYIFSKQ